MIARMAAFSRVGQLSISPYAGYNRAMNLADEALTLADGADIHDVAGLVAIYRHLEDAATRDEIERELRSFVARKRLAAIPFSPLAGAHSWPAQ